MDITGSAFITGGGNGIGRACAHALAKSGARAVIVSDIDLPAAQKVVVEIRSVATNPEHVKATITHTMKEYGRIDYCVHSAAGLAAATYDPVSAADFSDFKRLLEVNVTGTFLVLNTITAAMKSQEPLPYDLSLLGKGSTRGAIATLGSLSSVVPLPNMVQYNTARHGVVGMTKTAAIDTVGDGIRVNCVCPAIPMIADGNKNWPGLEEAMLKQLPMGRLALPEEVAEVVLFLCSSRSSYVTGSSMIVDGGMSLTCRT